VQLLCSFKHNQAKSLPYFGKLSGLLLFSAQRDCQKGTDGIFTGYTLLRQDFQFTGLYHIRISAIIVKTARIAGGLLRPYKGLLLAAPQGAAFTSFKPDAPIT